MPIPDEKARAWTRPEDYWPPRRSARSRRQAQQRSRLVAIDRGDPTDSPRPLLGIVPYFLLMVGLGILAVAIMAVAWPGNRLPIAPQSPATAEIGTAPKGWMDRL